MKSFPTVEIGIPAHNEAQNIGHLLLSLVRQKTDGFELTRVVVHSDGSTDDTAVVAKLIRDRRITVVSHPERLGQNQTQNAFFEACAADIAVLLNADILPASETFLQELVEPFLSKNAPDLTSSEYLPLPAKTRIERCLAASVVMKNSIGRSWNHGDNFLSCRGHARAFSRALYAKLRWPGDVPEDAYSYFFCHQQGGVFQYCPSAHAYLRLPQTLADHVKQSHRFILGQRQLKVLFGENVAQKHYQVPLSVLIPAFLQRLLLQPVAMLGYLGLMIWIRLFLVPQPIDHSKFETVASSKKLL